MTSCVCLYTHIKKSRGGGEDEISPEVDWGSEEGFTRQDLGAIYAQGGWDPANMGGAAGAAVAAAAAAAAGGDPGASGGIHPFIHRLGAGDAGGRDGWIRGPAQDHLSVWGVQAPPGLARQYATTRNGERGTGNVVSSVSWRLGSKRVGRRRSREVWIQVASHRIHHLAAIFLFS